MPYLAFNLNNGNEFIFDLVEERLSLGRNPRNEIVIENNQISSFHAELLRQPDGNYEIIDLKSSNGTYVNGKRAERAMLKPGDKIRFGQLEASFRNIKLPGGERESKGSSASAEDKRREAEAKAEIGHKTDMVPVGHETQKAGTTTAPSSPPAAVQAPAPSPLTTTPPKVAPPRVQSIAPTAIPVAATPVTVPPPAIAPPSAKPSAATRFALSPSKRVLSSQSQLPRLRRPRNLSLRAPAHLLPEHPKPLLPRQNPSPHHRGRLAEERPRPKRACRLRHLWFPLRPSRRRTNPGQSHPHRLQLPPNLRARLHPKLPRPRRSWANISTVRAPGRSAPSSVTPKTTPH